MKLTRIERLLLSNQLRILAKLYPEEATMHETDRKIVDEGFALHYKDLFQHMDEEVSEEQCRYVLDFLEMFSDLHYSYERLEDKASIEARKIKFLGFDGNNESELLCYAEFFIKDKGRYDELSRDDFNSHMPTGDLYARMLEAWRPLKAVATRELRQLSKEEIQTIVSAR